MFWSKKTVVLVTKEAFLDDDDDSWSEAAVEAVEVATSATFLLGEKVKEDLRPPWLKGVETPEDPLKRTSLRSELEVHAPLVGDLDLSLNFEEWYPSSREESLCFKIPGLMLSSIKK